MEEYSSYHNLGNGYYMKKTEWFEGGWGIKGLERHYDPNNRCIYTKEYSNEGIYETWRWYHWNGELAGVSNNKGMIQRFNEQGLPIKEG